MIFSPNLRLPFKRFTEEALLRPSMGVLWQPLVLASGLKLSPTPPPPALFPKCFVQTPASSREFFHSGITVFESFDVC